MNIADQQKRLHANDAAHAAPLASAAVSPTAFREPQADLWRMSQRALRGRYRLALMLAAGGGIAGAAAGAIYGQRLYRATGLVRIANSLPPVMKETDQNRPIAMLDGFMQAQRDVISSREMIQTAMNEPSWQQATYGGGSFSDERFAANLKVETKPRSDYLRVTFTDVEPVTAAAAVQAIVSSFQRDYTQEQDRIEGQRTRELTGRRDTLEAELRTLEEDVAPFAQGHEAGDLEPLYLAVGDRVKKLRAALAEAQCAMAGMTDELQRQPVAIRSGATIAADDVLRVQSLELARIETQIEDRQGYFGPAHPIMVRLQAQAKLAKERVVRAKEAAAAAQIVNADVPSALSLTEREANLRRLTLAAEEEFKRLSTRRAKLAEFDERAAVVRKNLADTNARIDALATEASQGGRLTVITSGEKPLTALLDSRPKFAAVGAMMGVSVPLGILIFGATMRRRYRYCDELADELLERVPFVAVLPEQISGVPEESVMTVEAARSVHQLRMRLQPPTAGERRTYLITSTAAGEGKSSTAVALALSFAAAGSRTLLIDADLKSRQVTRWFEATDEKGAIEAMAGEKPIIRRTKCGLCVLPAGQSRIQHTFAMSPAAIAKLIDSVRQDFDVILIDGEPILTSAAASSIAPKVDGVILTVARGQEQPQVDRALRYVKMVGAEVACIAFNKAAASDFREAIRESRSIPQNERVLLPAAWAKFGALAGPVMWSLTLCQPDDLRLLPNQFASTEPGRAAA